MHKGQNIKPNSFQHILQPRYINMILPIINHGIVSLQNIVETTTLNSNVMSTLRRWEFRAVVPIDF